MKIEFDNQQEGICSVRCSIVRNLNYLVNFFQIKKSKNIFSKPINIFAFVSKKRGL